MFEAIARQIVLKQTGGLEMVCGRNIVAVLIAVCAIPFSFNQSLATTVCAQAANTCLADGPGSKNTNHDDLNKYSGYYKFDDKLFWHIVSISGHLYVVVNDAAVRELRQKTGAEFHYEKSDSPKILFKSGLDGLVDSVSVYESPGEAYVADENGIRSQVQEIPGRELVATRVSKEIARSIYGNLKSDSEKFLKSRTPIPSQLPEATAKKINSFIINQTNFEGKFNPYLFAEGSVQGIEYLGKSLQGEQVLKVSRERSVRYWKIVLNSKDEITSSFVSDTL